MNAVKVRVEIPVYERNGSQNPDGLAPFVFESYGSGFILLRVGIHSYMLAPEDIERAIKACYADEFARYLDIVSSEGFSLAAITVHRRDDEHMLYVAIVTRDKA